MKLKGLVLGATVAIASFSAMTARANAQVQSNNEPSVLETMDEIGAAESGDYSSDRSSFRQTAHYFGLGVPGRSAFPELELDRNSDAILEAYKELLILQTQNTPTLRVPDLATPYNTSLQRMPAAQSRSRVVGSELNFQPLPRR
ncbi:MAG: hypothetical protein ACFB2W_03890 [Leptolyngbyaceae cyanobacterium]